MLTKIASIKDSTVELGAAQGLSEKYCRQALEKISNNELRIKETIKLGAETMKIVNGEYQKVRTAMMW